MKWKNERLFGDRGFGPRSRRDRRQHHKEIVELTARASAMHKQLIADGLATAHAHPSPSAELVATAHQRIEEYVDLQAKVFDLDINRAEKLEDPQLLELLVKWQWRGVQTPEQAEQELGQEVALRSVGKTDLALLLSSVDHTAFNLYANLPDRLRELHGGVFIEEAMRVLRAEDFQTDLTRDPQWVEMRKRWVRLGWRGAADDTFNAAFVQAVVERVALVHDGQGDDAVHGGLAFDTILDDRLKRENPKMRERMTASFGERLEREYALLVRPAAPRPGSLRESIDNISQVVAGADAKTVLHEANEVALVVSDHNLMRVGRTVWDGTYAVGWTDEQVRDEIASYVNVADAAVWPDHLLVFAAKWAVHAFQRLMTSHTFAAALMCSDVQQEVLDDIEKQWDAFLVIVPNKMLVTGPFEFSRVLVATYSFGARMILLTADARSVEVEAPTIAELLASDESNLVEESAVQRCVVMAKRLVAGLLLNLQHPPTFTIKKIEARPKSKHREAEPEHRIVTVGKPLEIDCREAVAEYIEHGKKGRKHGPPTVQVMVRGHYRRQVCGVGRMERKVIWIEPFWRGPEAALIQTRPKVPS